MTGTLDYVRKGEPITAEAWNALVERINALEQRPSFGFGVSRRPKGGGDKRELSFDAAQFVTDVNWEAKTIPSVAGSAVANYTPEGAALFSLDGGAASSTVQIVTDIAAVNGILGVETKTLSVAFTGINATISSTVNSRDVTVFSFLGAPKSAAITNVVLQ